MEAHQFEPGRGLEPWTSGTAGFRCPCVGGKGRGHESNRHMVVRCSHGCAVLICAILSDVRFISASSLWVTGNDCFTGGASCGPWWRCEWWRHLAQHYTLRVQDLFKHGWLGFAEKCFGSTCCVNLDHCLITSEKIRGEHGPALVWTLVCGSATLWSEPVALGRLGP